MPYEAVSAYTMLIGEIGGATTITVHGSADEAWQALTDAVRARSTRWLPKNAEAAELADRWRSRAPDQRFWQVSPHQLQVMVPAAGETANRPAATAPPGATPGLDARADPTPAPEGPVTPRAWRRRRHGRPAVT